jgi:hypothetical protein
MGILIKMKNYLWLAIITLTIIQSCSKSEDNNTNNNTSSNSPFLVRYEIISTSNVISPGSTINISYTNATGQLQTENFSNSSNLNNWNKSFNVTATTRPLTLNLSMISSGAANGGYLAMSNAGTITQNIYINGTLKSSNVNNSTNTSNSWGFQVAPAPINYTVQ